MGGFTQAFAAASGIIQWQALLVALYPFCFIEMDGYHVLVDVLGVPTLKHDALAYVKGLLSAPAGGGLGREEVLWVGYVVLSTLSVAAFIAFNVLDHRQRDELTLSPRPRRAAPPPRR